MRKPAPEDAGSGHTLPMMITFKSAFHFIHAAISTIKVSRVNKKKAEFARSAFFY